MVVSGFFDSHETKIFALVLPIANWVPSKVFLFSGSSLNPQCFSFLAVQSKARYLSDIVQNLQTRYQKILWIVNNEGCVISILAYLHFIFEHRYTPDIFISPPVTNRCQSSLEINSSHTQKTRLQMCENPGYTHLNITEMIVRHFERNS